ncbi:MAG: ABC transporter ATP-binding protein [Hyphomicrobiales bacterium]
MAVNSSIFLRNWGPRGTVGASIPSQLIFDHIHHAYGGRGVLNGVNLAVEPGEVVSLLGPSGCGKTTLLRVAAGVEKVTSGRVVLDGRELSSASRHIDPESRGIGMMFQDYALFPHLTVAQNVLFGLRHFTAADASNSLQRALSRVGLTDKADLFPHMLSGGEQQRAALARTVAPRPGVILMDEPFSNLDRRMRDRVREETIALLRELGATTFIVTHDPEEAMRISDRIALMRDGIVVQIGAGEDLYRSPIDIDAARFLFDFTELPGIARSGCVVTPLGEFVAPERLNSMAVVLCVRPNSVRTSRSQQGVQARILSRQFLGEVWFVEFGVHGLDIPLKARMRSEDIAEFEMNPRLTIDQKEVLVFAA